MPPPDGVASLGHIHSSSWRVMPGAPVQSVSLLGAGLVLSCCLAAPPPICWPRSMLRFIGCAPLLGAHASLPCWLPCLAPLLAAHASLPCWLPCAVRLPAQEYQGRRQELTCQDHRGKWMGCARGRSIVWRGTLSLGESRVLEHGWRVVHVVPLPPLSPPLPCAALLPDPRALLLATHHPLQWLTTGTLAMLEEAGPGVSCCSPHGLVAGLFATGRHQIHRLLACCYARLATSVCKQACSFPSARLHACRCRYRDTIASPRAGHHPRSPAAAIECVPLPLVCCAGERAGGREGGGGPQVPLSDQRGAAGSRDLLPQARSAAARQQDSGTGCGAAAAVRGYTGRCCASCATRPPHKLSTNNAARSRGKGPWGM